jgi:hypothetical protein
MARETRTLGIFFVESDDGIRVPLRHVAEYEIVGAIGTSETREFLVQQHFEADGVRDLLAVDCVDDDTFTFVMRHGDATMRRVRPPAEDVFIPRSEP